MAVRWYALHCMYAKDDTVAYIHEERSTVQMYGALLSLASSALAEEEFKQDSQNSWEEPYWQASKWKPCADRKYPTSLGKPEKSSGYTTVSANGGLNQQRVATCNAFAVASLLNATLVLPKFLYSNAWKDPSRFGDIYQEDYFLCILKDDLAIVKELPPHLKSLDIEAIEYRLLMQISRRKQSRMTMLGVYFPSLCRTELFTSLDLAIDLALIHCLLTSRD